MPGETAQRMIPINGELVYCFVLFLANVLRCCLYVYLDCIFRFFWSLSSLRPESESSSESRSRSRSPGPEKITFITSFGGSDDEAAAATQTAAPHSGHAPSNLQHPAGHSRGSRSVTFPLPVLFPLALMFIEMTIVDHRGRILI